MAPNDRTVFNGPVETGLRSAAILSQSFPETMSLQRLIVFDYLTVHSDDVEGGPVGLHPKTPYRGSEVLVRREVIQEGLLLYRSRGLVRVEYAESGVGYGATDSTGSFLDAFGAPYVGGIRERAGWVTEQFAGYDDVSLYRSVGERIGQWGAEFEVESRLRDEHDS